MEKRDRSPEEIKKRKLRGMFGFTLLVVALLSWVFAEELAIVLLYIPGHGVTDIFLFERAQIVISFSVVIITALILYDIYAQLTQPEPPTQLISKEAVSDLMLSHEQFRKLYDNSPVPYFLTDDAGNIRNPNRAALRFFGGTVEECTNTNFYELLDNEGNAEQTISLLRTKVERSVPISQEEMAIQSLDKEKKRIALVSIYSLERTSPIPFKHLVTLVDVSKEKENEEMKTNFLLLASHQLRTPLTTVKWYIDYLLSAKQVEMGKIVRDYLEQIYIGNERMIELITTLLTVSRIEMGTLAPDYKSLRVKDVIDDILDELSADVQKRGTHIQILSDGNDEVVMDYTMVRIIIHNLLTNAVKYTPNNGTVIVDSKFEPHACTISVTDTGFGIPLDEQDKIFTKMYRASNAKKISTNGTGLGLYMSRAFAEKLGGELTFHSEEGKGSTFTVSLPRVAPDA
jgi:two-component system sensor histidine kinase VicK